MNSDPESAHGIQPAAEATPPPLGTPEADTVVGSRLSVCVLFGAAVGALFGGLLGGGGVRLLGTYEQVHKGMLIGVLAGLGLGAVVAFAERKIRGAFTRPDVASYVGVVFGLLPAGLLLLVAFLAVAFGEFGGVLGIALALGLVFIGPMFGMLIGGVLDRVLEASMRGEWFAALRSFLVVAVICGGLAFLVLRPPAGPAPLSLKDLTNQVRASIIHEIRAEPGKEDTSVDDFVLVHEEGNRYSGSMELSLRGKIERYRIELTVAEDSFEWTITPID